MEDSIEINAEEIPGKGWAEQFANMHENGDDILLIPEFFENENDYENLFCIEQQ